MRTAALVAVLGVILLDLLPQALEGAGWRALILVALGALAPYVFEGRDQTEPTDSVPHHHGTGAGTDHSRVHSQEPHPPELGLELSYAGLIVHHVGDGLALGVLNASSALGLAQLAATAGLVLHTIPVTAVMVMAFSGHSGKRAALIRATGLAGAVAVGIIATALVPPQILEPLEPWLSALVAGLLTHVVAHDWHRESEPILDENP